MTSRRLLTRRVATRSLMEIEVNQTAATNAGPAANRPSEDKHNGTKRPPPVPPRRQFRRVGPPVPPRPGAPQTTDSNNEYKESHVEVPVESEPPPPYRPPEEQQQQNGT